MSDFIRHPSPNGYLRGRQGWRGGTTHGRWSAERLVVLLKQVYPEVLTSAHLARELQVSTYQAEQMALTAWRNGQVEFKVGLFDLEWRAIVEEERTEFTVEQHRAANGHLKWGVLHEPTKTWHYAELHGRIAAEALCRKLNKEISDVPRR